MSAKSASIACKRASERGGARVDRPHVVFRADWRRAARRLIVGGLCAATVASLSFPSTALAAEWGSVGGTQYNAGTAAGDEAGTWSWDGANDMRLNGYDGGSIEAAGRLDLTYEGENTVTNDEGEGITAVDGAQEKAELNITGGASDSLTVDASGDAIASDGDINVSGDGTISATSSDADGIDAEGGLSVSGSGNVTATGDSDGIEVSGDATIDSSGSVIAKGSRDDGLDVGGSLTIRGGGSVEASSDQSNGIAVDENLDISGGGSVTATSEHDAGVQVDGALSVAGSSLTAAGRLFGIYAYKGVTFDHATIRATASNAGDEAVAILADEDDIIIKNGSDVDAFAEGWVSSGIQSYNYKEGNAGGHVFISDSVVRAIARHLAGDGEDGGESFGIRVATKGGVRPARLSIVRSTVTAGGDTAAILVYATSEDGGVAGTIELEGSLVQAPTGGRVSDYNAKSDEYGGVGFDVGQTIGLSGGLIDSLDSADIAKSTVIVPEATGEPEPVPSEPAASGPASVTVTQASAHTSSSGGRKIPQTGDESGASALLAGLAGMSLLAGGLFVSRKRS